MNGDETTDGAAPDILARLGGGAGRHPAPDRKPIDCGHFDMRIDRAGVWYYRASPIGRKPLVKLFASVLTRDADGQFWLETPVERGRIDVDDAPFTAVEMRITGAGRARTLTFRTNLDEWVAAGPEHPITASHDPETGAPAPYVRVRGRMDALIIRAVYYDLVALGEPGAGPEAGQYGVWAGGVFHTLGPLPEGM